MRWTGTPIIRDLYDDNGNRLATVYRNNPPNPVRQAEYEIILPMTKEVYTFTGTPDAAQAYATALARMQ